MRNRKLVQTADIYESDVKDFVVFDNETTGLYPDQDKINNAMRSGRTQKEESCLRWLRLPAHMISSENTLWHPAAPAATADTRGNDMTVHEFGKENKDVLVMKCSNCAANVENAINRSDDTWARVNLGRKRAEVLSKTEKTGADFTKALKGTGYKVTGCEWAEK